MSRDILSSESKVIYYAVVSCVDLPELLHAFATQAKRSTHVCSCKYIGKGAPPLCHSSRLLLFSLLSLADPQASFYRARCLAHTWSRPTSITFQLFEYCLSPRCFPSCLCLVFFCLPRIWSLREVVLISRLSNGPLNYVFLSCPPLRSSQPLTTSSWTRRRHALAYHVTPSMRSSSCYGSCSSWLRHRLRPCPRSSSGPSPSSDPC